MQKIVDKAVLLVLCLLLSLAQDAGTFAVVGLLTAVALTALCSYLPRRWGPACTLPYLLLCCVYPLFLLFLPLCCYDCTGQDRWYLRLGWLVPLAVSLRHTEPSLTATLTGFCLLAVLLARKTAALADIFSRYYLLQDNTREAAINLQQKNHDLMEKQDYEVRLATLAERNRIAREIHDNVGHLLTRSLLQVGALEVVYRDQEPLREQLDQVKATLSGAMDNIRSSVHDLHDESVDLGVQLRALAESTTFCPVQLECEIEDAPREVKYCFIAILREALSNIARHSDATGATVRAIEHPALYQLIIQDNGSRRPAEGGRGIGLQNMRDRVEALGGVFTAGYQNGFRLFISIPKEH